MHMLDQRLQVLVSKDQRRRLEEEARRRNRSVGAVIREAVDQRYGGVTRVGKVAAAARIAGMSGSPVSLEEIEAVLDGRFDVAAPAASRPE